VRGAGLKLLGAGQLELGANVSVLQAAELVMLREKEGLV